MKHIDVQQLTSQYPLLQSLIALEPVTWFNPKATPSRRPAPATAFWSPR